MRRARLKGSADAPVEYYHCLSRVVDRQFILHETEKDQFVSLMREYEAFCEEEELRRALDILGWEEASTLGGAANQLVRSCLGLTRRRSDVYGSVL
jgi:hypothetical protein